MKHLQRHWRLTGVCFAVAILGIGLLLRPSAVSGLALPFPDPVAYEPVDAVQHDAVLTLLDEVSLDRDALVALNLSSAQAEALLAAARSWQTTNVAALASQKTVVHQARAQVRTVRKAIAMGPYQEGHEQALASAIQALNGALSAYAEQLQPLRTSLETFLSDSQRAAWAAIEQGHGQTMPIRLLDLTGDQRLALSAAQWHYRCRRAAAPTEQERSQAVADWQAALGQILSTDNHTVVDAYGAYLAASSQAVAEALAAVLPLAEDA